MSSPFDRRYDADRLWLLDLMADLSPLCVVKGGYRIEGRHACFQSFAGHGFAVQFFREELSVASRADKRPIDPHLRQCDIVEIVAGFIRDIDEQRGRRTS